MKRLVFLVEEQSMEAALNELLPRLLETDRVFNEFYYQILSHEGKSDLINSIKKTLQNWGVPHSFFIILHDKDSADCLVIKQQIAALCVQTGYPNTLIRIPCHELESWFLGDLAAIDKAFGTHLRQMQDKRKFRHPDILANAKEELKKYVPHYQQISGARAIAQQMSLTDNRSHSFNVFISGLRKLLKNATP